MIEKLAPELNGYLENLSLTSDKDVAHLGRRFALLPVVEQREQMSHLLSRLRTYQQWDADLAGGGGQQQRVLLARRTLRDWYTHHEQALKSAASPYEVTGIISGSMQYGDPRNLDSDLTFWLWSERSYPGQVTAASIKRVWQLKNVIHWGLIDIWERVKLTEGTEPDIDMIKADRYGHANYGSSFIDLYPFLEDQARELAVVISGMRLSGEWYQAEIGLKNWLSRYVMNHTLIRTEIFLSWFETLQIRQKRRGEQQFDLNSYLK